MQADGEFSRRPSPPQTVFSRTELPAREALREPAGDPFSPRSWQPPPAVVAAPPAAPAPPALPYRYAGALRVEGALQILLAKGDRVAPVKAGDVLEDGYRVESVGPDSVTLVYAPLNSRIVIEFTAPLAEGGEAIEAPQADARATPPPVAASAATADTATPGQAQAAGQRPAKLAW
ncbi:MAG: hypothetical protein ACREUO_12755, partial [Burkholderiales bacterium]